MNEVAIQAGRGHKKQVTHSFFIRKWLKLPKLSAYVGKLLETRKVSLTQQYITFCLIIAALTIGMSAWVTLRTYQELKADQEFIIEKEGLRLNFELHQHVSLIENAMLILADKVLRNGNYSLPKILEIINNESHGFRHELFSWEHVGFVTPEGYVTFASTDGSLPKSMYYGSDEKGWRRTAKYLPFKLQFEPPKYGKAITDAVIPSALGITSKRGKFIGYITSGIVVNRLQHSLAKSVGHNTSFIMLDDELNFITSSDSKLNEANIKVPVGSIREVMHRKYIDPKSLAYSVRIGENTYTHYVCSERYPFIFLIGQHDEEYNKKLWKHINTQITRNFILGGLFLAILLILGYQVTRPIIQLGQIADSVSKGKKVRIPSYKVKELNLLAEQLAVIQQIHAELRNKQAELTQSNYELRNANEFIRSNMSFLSHELRNPVASILGFSQMLKERIDAREYEEEKEYISVLHSAAVYQNRQIDFFLNLFRFQEQGKRIESVHIDLEKLIYTNINMIRHHALNNDVKIEMDIAPNLPKLIGDEIIISQMIQNLAANGAKYNKVSGTLTIRAFTRYNNTARRELVIQFRDTGIGIAAKDLDIIFEKFQRVRSEYSKDVCGYGIGLSYAKHCAVLHDGEITVKSKVGVGSEFSVVFPKFRIYDPTTAEEIEQDKESDK